LGESKRKPFGVALGRAIGWKVEGGRWKLRDLAKRLSRTTGRKAVVWGCGPKNCRRVGIVTGGFGDLDQVLKAGLDTMITGEADYPTEVKARELGINLILGGHKETEVFGVKGLRQRLQKMVD
jgi:putative NIF3 family GTP cyclohydrolase 1 type 2